MDIADVTLEDLWEAEHQPGVHRFGAKMVEDLPEPVRRYLTHAIAEGAPLARAVRLEMEGEIKLEEWRTFEASQVIRWDAGLIWKARAHMAPGIVVSGSDRVIAGKGMMDWRLFGLIPVVHAEGADVSRSAAGRLEAESIWLPSVLLDDDVRFTVEGKDAFRALIHVPGHAADVHFEIDASGALKSVHLKRWGDADGNFHDVEFGAVIEAEATFAGYTVPTRARVGWFFGTPRFDAEGEFFRATVTSAEYR